MSKNETRSGLTFKQWLAKVDAVLEARTGMQHDDLSDFPAYDNWSDEMSPSEGAENCLEYSDFGMF